MSLLSISWIEMTLSDAIGRWTTVSPCIVGASRYSFPLNLTLQSFFLVVQLLRWSLGEASYYPPFLGIIKEILSRGPQLVDMERLGIDWLMMSTYTDGNPLHHHASLVHHAGIHHINLFSKGNGSCSMRYKLGIVVCVTFILESFEHVAFKVAFDYRTSTWKLYSFPCFTLVVDIVP